MSNTSAMGSYWAGTSVIHRMDARAKLLLALAIMPVVFMAQSFAALAVCGLFVFAFFVLAHIPFKAVLKSTAPFLLLVLMTGLLNIFFVQGGTIYFEWWVFCVSEAGLIQAAFIACRLAILLLGVSLLTLTTTTLDITDAFEYLLNPFKRIGVPAHELSMMMGIALRFLPQFSNELITIHRAQISRGAQISQGKLRTLSSLMIPLFTSAFRHAETLSAAMDARCYHGGPGRTKLQPATYSYYDACGIGALALMCVCVVTANIFSI